jgi:CheY-like chemotaxis protein
MQFVAILVLALAVVALTTRVLALRRRLADAEARALRRNGDFLIRALSHELRTPLTALIGFAEVARQPGLEEERRAACLAKAIDSAQRLVHQVHDVFDLARLQDGELVAHEIDCRLDDVLDEALAGIRAEVDRKGLLLAVRVDDAVPQQVRLDPTRTAQTLRLLLGNAVKFTRRGHVGLRVEMRGRLLSFEVRDTGPGVPAKAHSGLFQVGRAGDQGPARPQGGSGLGLSLAARLATALGGALHLESGTAPGARFRLELPYVAAATTPEPAARAPARADRGAAAPARPKPRFVGRVLIVDDARDNQVLIRHVLGDFGLEADIAENGQIALRALDGRSYDLVLMDMQMPVLDGYATAAELRRRGDPVPIVALTAHAFAGERERCLETGCDEFLTKPIDRRRLGELLSRFLPAAPAAERAAEPAGRDAT